MKKKKADLKFTTTLLQLHFLITDKTIPVQKERKGKKKKLRGSSLMEEHAGTAKLVLDIINTQKNDAR